MPDIHRPVTRRLRLFLRDFRMIEAFVSTAEGQPLTSYVSNRRRYINLRAAHWADATSDRSHAALQVSHVLWASAPDGDMPLVNSSGVSRPREVELQLEGGLVVRGALPIFEQQRLSDFLLWECAYAELYFTGRMWPEFTVSDLEAAVREYHGRERRFGALPKVAAS